MDSFFTKKICDRCHKSLINGRICSMYNNDCICLDCKKEEMKRPDYSYAQKRELEEVRKGNYNFEGVGLQII